MGVFSFFAGLFSKPAQLRPIDYIFVGLGNIGDEYAGTRHNIGFNVADALIDRLQDIKSYRTDEADYVIGTLDSKKTLLVAKPSTLMNRSGLAVDKLIKQFNVGISSLMVFVDDFNIPLGTVRARRGGSHGGHNGLKSIGAYIGPDYPRLRIGIGPLPQGTDIIQFVLGKFNASEHEILKDVVVKAVEASLYFAECNDIDAVMNKYNK